MVVTSIVVQTLPGKARAVAKRMARIPGIESPAAESDRRIVATWRVPDNDALESLSEALHALNPEITEVYPTVLGEDR